MSGALLEVRGLRKSFGGVAAVDGCGFTVLRGSVTGLLGPNGSGKSTVINLVSGYLDKDEGSVTFGGIPIDGLPPREVYRRGLSRTFQQARIFPQVSVLDNLLAAVPKRPLEMLRPGRSRADIERAMTLLARFRLEKLRDVPASDMSYGQTKLLEFAAVLMAQPEMILLDEPTAGVNPKLVDVMADQIERVRGDGVTILLVEHNMEFVMGLCDWVVVLESGRTIFMGQADEAQTSPVVLDAYLGA